jgi:hypothetical protein
MDRIFYTAFSLVIGFSASSACAQMREWTDNTGKHKIQAELLEVTPDGAKLRRADGIVTVVPLNRLSATDQKFLEESRQNPLAAAGPSAQSTSQQKTPLDSVVRIVFSATGRGKPPEEIQVLGVAVQTSEPGPVIVSTRLSPKLIDAASVDAGLTKAMIYTLSSQQHLGTVESLGFAGLPAGARYRPGDSYIVLKLKESVRIPALLVSTKAPSPGDTVQLPELPAPQRRGMSAPSNVRLGWTPCTVLEGGKPEIAFNVAVRSGRLAFADVLPVINSQNELVGLTYAGLGTLGDQNAVMQVSGIDEVFAALEKAKINVRLASVEGAARDASSLPTQVDPDAPWRKSFEQLLAVVKTEQGKPTIDWGPAKDFQVWYERNRALHAARFQAKEQPQASERRLALQKIPALEKEAALADGLLKGIEWTATVKQLPRSNDNTDSRLSPAMRQSVELSAFGVLEIPQTVYPLSFSFQFEPGDKPNWQKLTVGDRARFACRFEINPDSSPIVPIIDVHMRLKEVVPR